LPEREKSKDVGIIPKGKFNIRIALKAVTDIDISLYDTEDSTDYSEGKAIVAWCSGVCNQGILGLLPGQESATYKGMTISYSGYNGDGVSLGNEWIEISGETTTTLMMRAFAYATGEAEVEYSWGQSQSSCCLGVAPCGGSFAQPILQGSIVEVGRIPVGKVNIRIDLRSAFDVDIQLYDLADTSAFSEGKAIIGWCGAQNCNLGLLNGPSAQSIVYGGITYKYSGYNGDGKSLGNEFIEITGTTTRPLVMTAFGFQPGEAEVQYTFWESDGVIPSTSVGRDSGSRGRRSRSRLNL
jgi:hypothetical protein